MHNDGTEVDGPYEGEDLGSTYAPSFTTFRVWSPAASDVKLVLFRGEPQEHPMGADRHGSWVTAIDGDLHGVEYLYRANINGEWREAIDPYGRASTINAGHSVVVDLARTDPARWTSERPTFSGHAVDAVFYEIHTRDFSMDPESGISPGHRGKWLAFTEHGTLTPSGNRSGIDPIRELGITHLQLLPIYDFGSVDERDSGQYNWGYDPVQYNVPDGSYATDAVHPFVRITELKQTIQSLHDDGLRVVMDVVYNHVFDAASHAFEKLAPGVFFRLNADGSYGNASGCGNEIASEHPMVRKFIVESVAYWAREYHVDGFRFDLMGILDVQTMRQVRAALDAIDPTILVIGEGWTMGNLLPDQQKADALNAAQLPGMGFFNDVLRDAVKGSVFSHGDRGYVQGEVGHRDGVLDGIVGNVRYNEAIGGMWGEIEAGQAVNYVEAHDNMTLIDKLAASMPNATADERARCFRLATSIVLLSQGLPFLHAGQDFMRSKQGDDNSYASGDGVNALRWEQRIERFEMVEYVRGLIAVRKAHPAFRMRSADEVRRNLRFLDSAPEMVAYALNGLAARDTWSEIVVVHNSSPRALDLTLPARAVWGIAVDEWRAGFTVPMREPSSTVEVGPQSTMVLFR
ncbi:MAG: type I pullulanase [Candidatus Nanopelagicales bacterium]